MPQYKLSYFNVRAKGELARLLFAVAGVEYEDFRVDFSMWPELKPSTPFGQLPTLEVDGKILCQSNTICRYLANKFGLAGKDDWEKARADMIVDCIEDVVSHIGHVVHAHNETDKLELKSKFEEKLPIYIENLEKLLKENKGGDEYFVGDSLTWADLAFSNLSSWTDLINLPLVLDEAPKLKALKEKVETEPKIAEWLAKRLDTK